MQLTLGPSTGLPGVAGDGGAGFPLNQGRGAGATGRAGVGRDECMPAHTCNRGNIYRFSRNKMRVQRFFKLYFTHTVLVYQLSAFKRMTAHLLSTPCKCVVVLELGLMGLYKLNYCEEEVKQYAVN